MTDILECIRENPIVAAVRRPEDVQAAAVSGVSTVFLLNSDLFTVRQLIETVRKSGKKALVHIDFVEGLGKDQKALSFLARFAKPDGIISTRTQLIKFAREAGIFAVQRFFLVDSQSLHTALRSIQSLKPDMIEVMPAVMPEVIGRISRQTEVPVIAGGLIESKQDILQILGAGAVGASTGKKELWNL